MLPAFIGISVLLIFILVLVLYTRKRNQKKLALFQEFAILHELNFNQIKKFFRLSPDIRGELDGYFVQVYEKTVGSGKQKKIYTLIRFSNCPIDFDFSIGKEGFISKVGKVFGFKDIMFHEQEFDKTFLLKSKDESRFKSMMDYHFQAKLMDIKDDLQGTIENESGVLTYTARGEIIRQDKIESLSNVLTFMVELQKSARK